jgi:hypothetical protein
MSKRNKKPNNIGTAMHTVSYLSQPYIKSDSKKRLTLQEIVENQEKHMMLIPRSEEDQAYIEELESSIVKDIPNEVLLQKCEEYFTHVNFKLSKEEINLRFNKKYNNSKKESTETFTSDEKLNLLCHCHNCNSYFPLRNLKWIDRGEKPEPVLHSDIETLEDLHWSLIDGNYSENENLDQKMVEIIKKAVENPNLDIFYPYDDLDSKYYGLEPKCAKYPICPSSWSRFDLWLREEQYSLEDHKKGKYDQ